jgi:hypothetical protein
MFFTGEVAQTGDGEGASCPHAMQAPTSIRFAGTR